MEPRKIVIPIIDETPGQPIGAEIQAILERERRYRSILIAGSLHGRRLGLDARPDLIIPILPASNTTVLKIMIL